MAAPVRLRICSRCQERLVNIGARYPLLDLCPPCYEEVLPRYTYTYYDPAPNRETP